MNERLDTLADDEPDTWPCYRHPDRETALLCGNCERPICTDCAVTAAVGMKCPDCARQSPAARAKVPTSRLARGLMVAAATGTIAGALHAFLNVGFFSLILAWLFGMGVGELARRASGGFRDPALARGVAAFTALGFSVAPVSYLFAGGTNPAVLIWPILAMIAAAVGAYTRCV